LTGEAVPVTEDLGYNDGTGYAAVASSVNNTLVYRAGTSLTQNQLAWFDRTGRETAKITQIGFVGEPALSPDETHLAYSVADPSTRRTDIWVADVARGTSSRLTFDAADELSPLWSPDGARIAYTLHTSGTTGAIYERPSNGSGTPVLRARGAADILSDDWSRDGRYLLYEDFHSATRRDLFALDLVTGQSIPVVASFGGDYEGKFSPDAKYVAYASNESGRAEVYVQTFPPTGGKWQISNAGGVQPVWSRNGREILYLDLTGKLAAAAVTTEGARFEAGIPQTLFAAPIPGSGDDFRHYTATRDGQRFVFDPATRQAEPTPITVVTNWRPDGEN
jgi:dipeptidyl aminopeptidase/acylaminoacyl peptidase